MAHVVDFKIAAASLPVDNIAFSTAEDGPARVAIAAQALGLPFVGRANGERAQELRAHGATAVLPDFTDLGAVLTAFETAIVPLAVPS